MPAWKRCSEYILRGRDIRSFDDADFNKDKVARPVMHLLCRYHIMAIRVPGMV